jgi:DNA-binding NarL/FixJ family response regulator
VTAIRVLLADDEPLVRSGLRAILESEPDLTVVGEADDGAAVIAQARRTRPDIVLMDVRMPRVDGIAATRQLGQFDGGGPAVIVVTTFENDDYVYDALQAGARGFLLKRSSAEDYVNAIRTVHEGESLLFPAAVRRLATRHGGPGGATHAGRWCRPHSPSWEANLTTIRRGPRRRGAEVGQSDPARRPSSAPLSYPIKRDFRRRGAVRGAGGP